MKSLIAFFAAIVANVLAADAKPLSHTLVVIDPGHGGMDSGAFKKLTDGKLLCENEHVYDIACRLRLLLLSKGATVQMTVRDPQSRFQVSEESLIPAKKTAVFNDDKNEVVIAGKEGLTHRIKIAKAARDRCNCKNVLFVCIHFDSTAKGIIGPDAIAPPFPASDSLAEAIVDSFKKNGHSRTSDGKAADMLLRSGDKKGHGLRNLYILDKVNNPIADRTLLELGNLQNPADAWRVRDPKARQTYAKMIAEGIAAFVAAPLDND